MACSWSFTITVTSRAIFLLCIGACSVPGPVFCFASSGAASASFISDSERYAGTAGREGLETRTEEEETVHRAYDFCEIWQDLRMVLSSALGFLLTHWVSTYLRRGSPRTQGSPARLTADHGRRPSSGTSSRNAVEVSAPSVEEEKRRFKLYCYAM